MDSTSSLSVLVPTHNRESILRDTLSAFTKLRVIDCPVNYVVIDNNSSDGTREVVREFEHQLNIVYLFESKPGKNCALNAALRTVSLGEVVVFADDDVTPDLDWLVEIVRACKCHPEYAVFGGRITPLWPLGQMPEWASDPFIQSFAYALHDYGADVMAYPKRACPFGPNFWVRRLVFDQGHYFDERIGPRPNDRIMGSESRFLRDLEEAGFKMLYYPSARVKHRIQHSECSLAAVRKRAFRLGRGEVYLSGLPRAALRDSSGLLWRFYLLLKFLYAVLRLGASWLVPTDQKRLLLSTRALRMIGNTYESMRHAP